ncbi:MAG TPA: GAF domain-containing protein [Mycobacterium sp.]|nr:GAF domain-containing protein [Mycobacterium sp.]
MAHDWLLLERLGEEPVVVAQGRQLKNTVPKRSPYLSEIIDAVKQTACTGTGVSRVSRPVLNERVMVCSCGRDRPPPTYPSGWSLDR